MPPSYVKAYLKRSKNDATDAAAICEAVTRPSMRFVPTKSEQQQSGLMLHRSRQLLVRQRTMLSNAIRGHMAELGIISAKGRNGTAELLEVIASAQDDRIPAAARFSLEVLARQYANVTAEIGTIEKRIHAWHRSCEESRLAASDPKTQQLVEGADLVLDLGGVNLNDITTAAHSAKLDPSRFITVTTRTHPLGHRSQYPLYIGISGGLGRRRRE